MNIQKHFSATLKHQRLLRSMSMREFSEERGIALSSLDEYDAGRRIPRSATIELIAEKLRISPAPLRQSLRTAEHALGLLRCAL